MRFLRNLAGIFVGKIVLRAQLIPIGELRHLKYIWTKIFVSQQEVNRLNNLWPEFVAKNEAYKETHPDRVVKIKRELVTTPFGSKLDTIELSAQNNNPTEYVIYGWGRSDCYEFYLSRLASDALNLNKRIISFNFRNVAHSKGQVYHEQDLINDYAFQVERLLKQGVSPSQIKCYGHSLCGAIATFSVADLIKKHKDLKFYNDRSFANLIDTSIALYFKRKNSRKRIVNVATSVLLTLALGTLALLSTFSLMNIAMVWSIGMLSTHWHPTHKIFDNTVGWFLETLMINTMRYGGWELKSAQAYDEIPLENKSHTVIKLPQKNKSKHIGRRHVSDKAVADRVILTHDTMHKHLHGYRRMKQELKHHLKVARHHGHLHKAHSHKEKLLDMANAKISGGGHMADPKEFVTWYKSPRANRTITGQERFYAFVEPNGGHENRHPKKYKVF
ncbi:MAG: hypothetical protein JSR17_13840 [Proteobacteria bacterium]|nr:hypothetical protein [Pseudomonadota bacterium]